MVKTKHYFRYKKADEITSSLIDETLVKTNKVNDFTDGSVIKTLYEAFSTEMEMFYYLTIENIKGGVWNSIYQAFDFGRKPQLRAYGDVVITFSSPTSSTIIIPKGAKATSSRSDLYDQVYVTMDEYTVQPGSNYARIPVMCTEAGVYGNIPSDTIDTITNVAGVDSVTNPESFSTGQNEETDAEVRVRFREFIQALQRGTVQALQYGAMTVPTIRGVYIDESVGYVKLYAHDANGDLSPELQQKVQNEILYWRPAGIPVTVLPIHKTLVDMNILLDVPNPALRTPEFIEYTRAKLLNYLNEYVVHQPLAHADVVQKLMDIDDINIQNTNVDIMVNPDGYKRNTITVNDQNSLIVNGQSYKKEDLYPKNQSHYEDYIVSNPEDKDIPKYAYITSDDIKQTTTTTITPEGDVTTEEKATTIATNLIKTVDVAQSEPEFTGFSGFRSASDTLPITDGEEPPKNEVPGLTENSYFVQLKNGAQATVQFSSQAEGAGVIAVKFALDSTKVFVVTDLDKDTYTVSTYRDNILQAAVQVEKSSGKRVDDYYEFAPITEDKPDLGISYALNDYKINLTNGKLELHTKSNPSTDESISVNMLTQRVNHTYIETAIRRTTAYLRTLEGILISSEETTVTGDGGKTVIYRNSVGKITRAVIYDKTGTILSDTESKDDNTVTSTTTLLPDYTVDGTQGDGLFVYRTELPDNQIVRVVLDKNLRVQDVLLTTVAKTQLHLVKSATAGFISASFYKGGELSDSKVIQTQESQLVSDYTVLNGLSQITVKDKAKNLLIVSYEDGKIKYDMANGTKVDLVININKSQKTITVDDGKGVTTKTTMTLAGNLVNTIVQYMNTDGTQTTIERNEKNEVVRTIITDKDGNIISDSGKVTTTTSTTKTPGETTTSTTTEAPTTTTTTTAYPFELPPDVSAKDATETGFIPVFGMYRTAPDEILRGRTIMIRFRQDFYRDN